MLELAIAHELYRRFPDFTEGDMAKLRSHVVSRASCAEVARGLHLEERLLASEGAPKGGEQAKLAENRNVLAALLEAALAALYLEHGFEPIAGAIVAAFDERIEYALTNRVDHKTELQETLARRGSTVSYVLRDAHGPPHNRTFTAAALVDGREAGVGQGSSKKDAEQQAAREALNALHAVSAAAAGAVPASDRSG